ncbi:ribosome recycling factor family protein, partial [Orientia tsutsugamushi str. Sido]
MHNIELYDYFYRYLIINISVMNHEELINSLTKKMNGALQVLDADLKGLRVGQASAYFLDPVQVEAYNSRVPILQVATISVSDTK